MSADSLEIRVVRLEADVRRIESVSEPRFERIEQRLDRLEAKLDKLDSKIDALAMQMTTLDHGIKLIVTTCATKEELQRELNSTTKVFIGWIALIAGLAIGIAKYL